MGACCSIKNVKQKEKYKTDNIETQAVLPIEKRKMQIKGKKPV